MKSKILYSLLFFCYNLSFTQQFTTNASLLDEGQFVKYNFADVDNDGDEDLLSITVDSSGAITLFINDGNGIFSTDTANVFPNWVGANAAFTDVDADSDLDLILAGSDANNNVFAKLYLNNGNGIFTEDTNNSFNGATNGDVDFADVDGDGDMDVVISGWNSFADLRTRLYINDGLGTFTMQAPFVLENTQGSENKFADLDGDGDLDIFQTGRNNNNDLIAKIFSNNGTGIFTEVAGTTFEPVENGDVDMADIDGDGDLDIALTGGFLEFTQYTKLYKNNGIFNFTEITNTGLLQLVFSDVHFVDIDNDSDSDLLISGMDNTTSIQHTVLYQNDGLGNFTSVNNEPFEGVRLGDIKSSDIDNDGDFDLIIGGLKDPNSVDRYSNKIFINNTTTLSNGPVLLKNQINFYPNPTANVLHIQSPQPIKKIEIYNLNGQLVQSAFAQVEIDLSNLPSGVYLAKIETDHQVMTKRIIKK